MDSSEGFLYYIEPYLPYIHGGAMLFALTLILSAILIARYGKKNKKWLLIHKSIAIIAVLFSILGLITAVYMVSIFYGTHFNSAHSFVGLSGLVLFGAAPILGFGIFKFKVKKEHKRTVRGSHRWVGRSSVLVMFAAVLLGLGLIGWLPFYI